ncbi:glutathione S-transferase family protein [Halieaceae bacterium IMCC14734]|uniref:Glutathione S-transferase family protein n=1 Tax=Candidatus Litorirhabdus singularis TaxID=2518993 RepID=A0ABT3TIH0_9GAMM|nr:glutathione S-transferase family protein [Candidatus Litorirhabdus singularis]MCX2982059.1 glutathione S-transferase family protein [Candidatus Litorirhabdus singularis]
MYKGDYQLVGSEMSFFTRKLEAQLRFQNIPWSWRFKTEERKAELEARAGTHFIPLLATPDKWLLNDTIAIGPMLNERFPQHPVVPESPLQRACCYILEDAFNHWLGRVCVHSRWCYPDNVTWVGPRFGANMMLDRSIETPFSADELEQLAGIGPMMYEGFGKNVCQYNGVGPDQAEAVKGDFQNMLDALAAHFANNDFLLGQRPCLADFALAGASKAHFICDPEPTSWLGEHREMMFDYTERFFTDWDTTTDSWPEEDQLPDTLSVLLDYLQGTYFKFATANIAAGLAGEKYYEYDYGFGLTRARTQKRLNVARLHVQDELLRLGADTNITIKEVFAGRGILEHYLA